MKLYVINGSPRKEYNTVKMLNSFVNGAKSKCDVDIRFINLYELDYKGCASCFACQLDSDDLYGRCHRKDGISDLLQEISLADAIVFGTPIYLWTISSTLHTFLERLIYQYLDFSGEKANARDSNAPKSIKISMIYTMNVNEDRFIESGGLNNVINFEKYLSSVFKTEVERICAYNTYQYDDYSKYRVGLIDEKVKAEYRENNFDNDLKNAFDFGAKRIEEMNETK